MKINRKEFLEKIKQALPGVDSDNSILEGTDTLLFDKGLLITYNDNINISIPCPIVDKEGNKVIGAAFKAKEMYEILNSFSGDNIIIIPKKATWILKSQGAIAELVVMDNPSIKEMIKILGQKMDFISVSDDLINKLAFTLIDGNKSRLAGILFKDNNLIDTDGLRINMARVGMKIGKEIFISEKSVSELIKLNNYSKIAKMAITDSWIHFTTKENIVFSTRKLTINNYPVQQIYKFMEESKADGKDQLFDIPSKMVDSIGRAFSLSFIYDAHPLIKLTIKSEGVEVYAERKTGKFTELVKWNKPIKVKKEKVIYVEANIILSSASKDNSNKFYIKEREKGDRILFIGKDTIVLANTFEEKKLEKENEK